MRNFAQRPKSLRGGRRAGRRPRRARVPGPGRPARLLRGVRAAGLGNRTELPGDRPREGRPPGDPLLQQPRLRALRLRRGVPGEHRRALERVVGRSRARPRPARFGQPFPDGRRAAPSARPEARGRDREPGERLLQRSGSPGRQRSARGPDRAPRGAESARGDPRGRHLRHPLHLRNHGPAEGLPHHPPRDHHAGHGHHPPRNAGRSARRGGPASERREPAHLAADVAALPRLGTSHGVVYCHGSGGEGGDERRPVRPGPGAAPDRTREGEHVGRHPDHAPPRGPLSEPRPLRPLAPDPRHRRWGADHARDHGAGGARPPGRPRHQRRLRHHGDPRHRDDERGAGAREQAHLGGAPRGLLRREAGGRARAARSARASSASCASTARRSRPDTGIAPMPRPRASAMDGSTPGTSPTAMPTATITSPTAPRT